jgi:anti-sigma-K factor RskA
MPVIEHPSDLLPGYTLDCLEAEEATAVARHLAACQLCRAEMEAYQSVAHQLALVAPSSEPPPELRQRLLARVQLSRSSGSAVAHRPRRIAGWPATGQAPAGRWRSLNWRTVLLLLVAILAAGNVLLWQQFSRLRQATPPRQVVGLSGTEVAPGASGVLVLTADGRQATLIVEGLPPLAAGEQYQLWLIQDGQRSNGGVFSVDPAGYHTMPVLAPQTITGYNAFGITIEPAGGSPGPTGPRVLGGAR